MRKKMVCICVALLTVLSASQMVATAENMTVAPDFNPVENTRLNEETVGDTDGCTAVIDDITLEELVASGEPLPVAENVGESSFTIGLARDASVHVMTSSDEGWVQSGSYWYYYDSLGNMVTGWLKDGTGSSATWYFCNPSNGRMISNQISTIDGDVFYFQSSGAMKTGWQQISGNWWYFTPYGQSAPEGSAVNGRVSIGSEIYYFRNYIMQHGKQYITTSGFLDGYYYFGNPGDEDSGCMMYGWLHDTEVSTNTWYYLGTNGQAYTGWHIISGTTYHFDSYAEMSFGTVRMGYSDFYFDSSGAFENDIPYSRSETVAGVNVKWHRQYIDNDGHRIASATIYNFNLSGNLSTAYNSLDTFFNSSAKRADDIHSIIQISDAQSIGSADIYYATIDNALEWPYAPNAAGVTTYCNENGNWADYAPPPIDYQYLFTIDKSSDFRTGKIYKSFITIRNIPGIDNYSLNLAHNLLRHETGHSFGLRHPWETTQYDDKSEYPPGPQALMYPVNREDWITFYDWDLDELYKTYPQEDENS